MLKRRVWIPIASAVFAVALIAAVLFFYSLLKVDILITELLLLVAAVLVLFLYVAGVLLFYGLHRKRSAMRRVRRIIGVVLSLVITFGCGFGAILMRDVNKTKNSVIAKPEEQNRAIVGVYVMKDDAAQTVGDTGGYSFAVLGDLGAEKINSNYAIGKINESIGTSVNVLSFSGITDAASALKNGDVQAMAVNKNYLMLLDDTESFSGFADNLRLVGEIPVPNTATLENTPVPHRSSRSRRRNRRRSRLPSPRRRPYTVRMRRLCFI